MFFLSFCLLGAPALVASSGCSGEAQASPPTQPSEAAESADADPAASPFWSQGSQLQVTAQPSYDPNDSLAPLVSAVQPAVVSIQARRSSKGLGGRGGGGIGSGFVIAADGLVVTNHHVVHQADAFEVHLQDGRRFQASVVGSDPQTDLALLQLSGAEGLATVGFGSSDALAVGDWVIAMGSPMGLDQTVTRGIVSAKGRGSLGLYEDGYVDFLQTDAAINPGNSGGPLFNLGGEVIGINTAVGGHDGLGFAIPVDQAKVVIPQLLAEGKVTRGWLGVSGRDEPAGYGVMPVKGAVVGDVHAGTPAAAAGLQGGDLITTIDGKPVDDFDDLRARIGDHGPGDKVALSVLRAGKAVALTVELGQRPDPNSMRGMAPSQPRPNPPAKQPPASSGADLYDGATPRLGVEVRESADGVVIERVVQGGVGHRLGLQPGDVIERVNGQAVSAISEILGALNQDRAGASVEVRRGHSRHSASIR